MKQSNIIQDLKQNDSELKYLTDEENKKKQKIENYQLMRVSLITMMLGGSVMYGLSHITSDLTPHFIGLLASGGILSIYDYVKENKYRLQKEVITYRKGVLTMEKGKIIKELENSSNNVRRI